MPGPASRVLLQPPASAWRPPSARSTRSSGVCPLSIVPLRGSGDRAASVGSLLVESLRAAEHRFANLGRETEQRFGEVFSSTGTQRGAPCGAWCEARPRNGRLDSARRRLRRPPMVPMAPDPDTPGTATAPRVWRSPPVEGCDGAKRRGAVGVVLASVRMRGMEVELSESGLRAGKGVRAV